MQRVQQQRRDERSRFDGAGYSQPDQRDVHPGPGIRKEIPLRIETSAKHFLSVVIALTECEEDFAD
jgi:hypothetical protein